MKTIQVKNCAECPFVLEDGSYGYYGCRLDDGELINLDPFELLPRDIVHANCPLKSEEVYVELF